MHLRTLACMILVCMLGAPLQAQEHDLNTILDGLKASSAAVQRGVVTYEVTSTDFSDELTPAQIDRRVSEVIAARESLYERTLGRTMTPEEIESVAEELRNDLHDASSENSVFTKTGKFSFDGTSVDSVLMETPAALQTQGERIGRVSRVTYDGEVGMSITYHTGGDGYVPEGRIEPVPIAEGQISRRHPQSFGRYADPSAIDSAGFSIAGEEELEDGRCVVLLSADGSLKSWVCPSKDFLILREESHSSGGTLVRFEISDIVESNDVYFPSHAVYRTFSPTGKQTWEAVFKFSDVKLDVDVNPQEFRITFPEGSKVVDYRSDPPVRYSVRDDGG